MGLLDYVGDAVEGGANAMLADLERKAAEKHQMAMANKAIERDFIQNRQQRKTQERDNEARAAQSDAERRAQRDREEADRKFEREKFDAAEAGRNTRHRETMSRPRGEATQAKPQLFELPNGDQVWVNPGAPIPKGARRANTSGKPAATTVAPFRRSDTGDYEFD